jgi:hypothetical protein
MDLNNEMVKDKVKYSFVSNMLQLIGIIQIRNIVGITAVKFF